MSTALLLLQSAVMQEESELMLLEHLPLKQVLGRGLEMQL
jgi:hypothetical protein